MCVIEGGRVYENHQFPMLFKAPPFYKKQDMGWICKIIYCQLSRLSVAKSVTWDFLYNQSISSSLRFVYCQRVWEWGDH